MRARGLARFIWNSFSPITETIDFINVLYECLPKQALIREYQRRGRQPNPIERMEILYRNINSLDVGCAMTGYIKEQITDMLYSIGGKQMAEANRRWNRPIGFEAGGGLNGYRPFIQVS